MLRIGDCCPTNTCSLDRKKEDEKENDQLTNLGGRVFQPKTTPPTLVNSINGPLSVELGM
jgi:hypothetical protein